jgi:hypothetical protein
MLNTLYSVNLLLFRQMVYHCNSIRVYVMRPRQMQQQQQRITPMSMHLSHIASETQFHLRSLCEVMAAVTTVARRAQPVA